VKSPAMGMPDPPEKSNVIGTQISAVNVEDTLNVMDAWIGQKARGYVCLAPIHSVMDAYRSPEVRRIFNHSGLTAPDGMGIVWLLKLRGHARAGRVYGPDLMLAAIQHGIPLGYKHFLLGGKPGVADDLARRLKDRFPQAEIVGAVSPPFTHTGIPEDPSTLRLIEQASPDIVWVGLGSPKQDRWMADCQGRLEVPVLVGVGAAFDFLSGHKPQAPRWVQRSGLEWLFRLVTEPRRLWPRYKWYPVFMLLVLAQSLGLKKFPVDG
jgi:N-acetylglucosaminyldiphosphoundecaprenol N-acetyl-beta-D-mannosaminyltransferase